MFDLLTSLLATAKSLFFDNTASGLSATNVQDAIDELNTNITAEDLWDRDTTGDPFITQNTAGDDLKLKDSGGNQTLFHDTSADSTEFGKTGSSAVHELKSGGVVKIKFNSVGDSWFNQNANFGIGDVSGYSIYNIGLVNVRGEVQGTTTDVSGATYTILETDRQLDVSRTASGSCVITFPKSQRIDGRVIDVYDAGGNASGNNIRIYDDSPIPVLLFTINTDGTNLTIRYSSVSGWIII